MTGILGRGRLGTLALGIASVCLLGPVQANEFSIGEVEGRFKSSLALGAAVRVSERNCEFISSFNPQGCDASGGSDDQDDGNLNYDRGDFVNARVAGESELELTWRDYGVFVRTAYYFDALNSNVSHPRRTDLSDTARQLAGRDIRLMDAYVYGDFDFLGAPTHIRLGNQVLNWGESSVLGGGINSYNGFDVSRLRTAGASLRGAFLPMPMINVLVEPVQDWQVSAFYMFDWKETLLDPVGTFFSRDDAFSPGRQGIFFGPDTAGALGDPGASGVSAEDLIALGIGAGLLPDRTPKNDGQWGVALLHTSNALDAEFGLYYVRYHHKVSIGGAVAECDAAFDCLSSYYREFVPNQSLYGISSRFLIGNVSVGTEVSYQPDTPVQRENTLSGAIDAALNEVALTGVDARSELNGVLRTNRIQAQVNAEYSFGPSTIFLGDFMSMTGMESLDVSGELAVVRFDNLPIGIEDGGTRYSWAYAVTLAAKYPRLFDRVSATPYVAFVHTPYGNEIDNQGVFEDNTKQVTLGTIVELNEDWALDVNYTNSFGGGLSNRARDRDFIAFSVSTAF